MIRLSSDRPKVPLQARDRTRFALRVGDRARYGLVIDRASGKVRMGRLGSAKK